MSTQGPVVAATSVVYVLLKDFDFCEVYPFYQSINQAAGLIINGPSIHPLDGMASSTTDFER
jgi:hypothetical protein